MKKILLGTAVALALLTGCTEEKKPATETPAATQEVKKDEVAPTTPATQEVKKDETAPAQTESTEAKKEETK